MSNQKTNILGLFPKCPGCGSEETLSMKAYAPLRESGKLAADYFPALKSEQSMPNTGTPMLAGIPVMIVITHYDACAVCGMQRVTRCETQTVVPMAAPPNNGGQQAFQSRPR